MRGVALTNPCTQENCIADPRDILLRRSKWIDLQTASLPQPWRSPPKTTAVMAGSNIGTLDRMRGSDAIGRVDYCPPSGRARAVSDQRRSRGLTQFLPRPVLSSFQTAET